MKYSILILVLAIFPLSFGFAQSNKSPETKEDNSQLIEISDMFTDPTGCFELAEPYVGIIKKRKFLSDEITIIGFVLMRPNDERVFINIDSDFIKKKSMVDRDNYVALMRKGNKVKVWAYICGAAGRVIYADNIKLEK